MSDPNSEFQPPPPPTIQPEPEAPRPTKLRPFAIGFFVVGVIILVLGILKVVPGGFGTGAAFVFWGILLGAFSFIRLPQTTATDEPPMSAVGKLTGIFYEPSSVFRNLRSHPHWLAAFLVIVLVNIAYSNAFVYRLTAERIVNHTFEKMEQSPIKPPRTKWNKRRMRRCRQQSSQSKEFKGRRRAL